MRDRLRRAAYWIAVMALGCGARSELSLSDELGEAVERCSVAVVAERPQPVVMLLVDQSGSMSAPFSGAGTRWTAVRDSLLGATGIVQELQARARFGLALYSARSTNGEEGGEPIGECPLLTVVAPALDNLSAISNVYQLAEPIEDTPTGDAVLSILEMQRSMWRGRDPTIFVIATDGEPDSCAELDPQNGQAHAVAAVKSAFDEGVRSYLIAVGLGELSAEHMQDMANAGVGVQPGDPPADYFEVGEDSGLHAALHSIMDRVLSCELRLDRAIDRSRACEGTFRIGDRAFPCNHPDGWRAVASDIISLSGDACAALEQNPTATLEASFPCDVLE